MSKNVGEKIYMYTMMNGKFFVHEGEVIQCRYNSRAKRVRFNDESSDKRYPNEIDIGIVCGGRSLWLEDRDDELAKRLFIEHEETCIAEFEELIRRKLANIKMLKD